MVESDGDRRATAAPRWRLAPGVGLLAGTAIGGERLGEQVYVLVLPSGRRFALSEPLYRLAELLAGERSLDEVATRLSEALQRPIEPAEVGRLIESRLAPQGLAVLVEPDTSGSASAPGTPTRPEEAG